MDEKQNAPEKKYKSKLFNSIASWGRKHGTVLTAVLLIAVSAVLGTWEANVAYGEASTDYGTGGGSSSPSYVGGGGNNPTVYEPGVIGVSVVTYDLNEVGKSGLEYGYKNKYASPVSSTSNYKEVEAAKGNYDAPADQQDYYPYWIEMGTTKKGSPVYKYSNNLHHTITSNILAMQTGKGYDNSTLVFVPRVVADKDHHSWIKNLTQSVVVNGSKTTKKKSVFYDLTPWYSESSAGNFNTVSKGVTDKSGSGVYYAKLKGYLKDQGKKATGSRFLKVKTEDGETYEVTDCKYFESLASGGTKNLDKIIGCSGGHFTDEGKKNLAKAYSLYSSMANVNEPVKGQYATTPEAADVFMRYTTAAGLGQKSYGTGMFSKFGVQEGLYGRESGRLNKVNKHMIGSQVIRSIYQTNKRLSKVTADGAKEINNIQKTILNDEYNTHYLDMLLCGYAIAKSSGDKDAANAWYTAIKTYSESAASDSASMKNVVIRLDMGMAYGTTGEVTYASTGDVMKNYYSFSDKVSAFESGESVNAKSLNKGFIGFAAIDDSSGQNYQASNREVASSKGVVTKSKYNTNYGTYYKKLENAVAATRQATGSGKGWYSSMVMARVTSTYFYMPNKSSTKPNSKIYNKLATVELLRTVASNYGVNARKGTTSGLAWQYGTYATDGFYWKDPSITDNTGEAEDADFKLAIYSTKKNGKAPSQNGKEIKDTFQKYSFSSSTSTATLTDDLYVKLTPGKDEKTQKLFNKILSSNKYYVKIVFKDEDGKTVASADGKTTDKVKDPRDEKTQQIVASKKNTTYYKKFNAYDSTNKGSEKGDEQNYNKLVSPKQVGGNDLQDNRCFIWRISNADVRTTGFKFNGTGSWYVNWKAEVYIFKKSGSGSKAKWTSPFNASFSATKTKPTASDLTKAGCATTNNVIAQYVYHKTPGTEEVNKSGTYESIPEAYAELKEGSIYNETFEAMAGVPSTRSLYFATGGSEFIVNMQAVYDDYYLSEVNGGNKDSYRSKRYYKSIFGSTDCEYKKGDELKTFSLVKNVKM